MGYNNRQMVLTQPVTRIPNSATTQIQPKKEGVTTEVTAARSPPRKGPTQTGHVQS